MYHNLNKWCCIVNALDRRRLMVPWVRAGTPVQNNLRELYGLMNLLDNAAYPDEADFFSKFGGDNGPPTIDQIKALQVCRLATKPNGISRLWKS
jgi:hypothetical protein